MLAVTFPEVPVIVTVAIPGAAESATESVKVLPLVDGFGEKAAVTPVGNPVAVKVTLPANPY